MNIIQLAQTDSALFNIYAEIVLLALIGIWGWVRYYNTYRGKANLLERKKII